MAVHDALHVGPLAQNGQVQQNLTATLSLAGQLLAFHVDNAQIVRLHKAFRNKGRRAEHFLFGESVADIAIIAGGEAFVVNPPANVADFEFELMQIHEFPLMHCFESPGTVGTIAPMVAGLSMFTD
jgi:hypothetical protein